MEMASNCGGYKLPAGTAGPDPFLRMYTAHLHAVTCVHPCDDMRHKPTDTPISKQNGVKNIAKNSCLQPLPYALQNAPSVAPHPSKPKAPRDPGDPAQSHPRHMLGSALFDRSIWAGAPLMAVSQTTDHLPAMHLDQNGSCFTPKMDSLQ